MTDARVSRAAAKVLVAPTPTARASRTATKVLVSPTPDARASWVGLRVLIANDGSSPGASASVTGSVTIGSTDSGQGAATPAATITVSATDTGSASGGATGTVTVSATDGASATGPGIAGSLTVTGSDSGSGAGTGVPSVTLSGTADTSALAAISAPVTISSTDDASGDPSVSGTVVVTSSGSIPEAATGAEVITITMTSATTSPDGSTDTVAVSALIGGSVRDSVAGSITILSSLAADAAVSALITLNVVTVATALFPPVVPNPTATIGHNGDTGTLVCNQHTGAAMDVMGQNDLLPAWSCVLANGSQPYDPTSATAISIQCWRNGTLLFNRSPTTVNPDGTLTMNWQTGDTSDPGPLKFKVIVSASGSRDTTFPPKGWMVTRVHPTSP